MSDLNKPTSAQEVKDPEPVPVDVATGSAELQLRVRCRGKTAAAVLDDVRLGLEESLSQGRDPLLVFEDLGLLQDSVATLIKGLCREMVGYPRTVTFWESSGFTEAFLSVMEIGLEKKG